ncbi:uncharacterized protein LOC132260057 [Phlebotomus argentipes]|uniref:uncharacterized protein LOC132260057 n=1 Tax=Phlebotomus argentipes TaxID=94469 RepID=UPI00289339ED|nr:uncharacterized protein LOC132260057 [Phlebotomus argentipes]
MIESVSVVIVGEIGGILCEGVQKKSDQEKRNRVPHLFFSYMKNQTTTTPFPGTVDGNSSEILGIQSDVSDILEATQETTKAILILGKDKVTRFYICISIALGISVLIAIIGITGFFFFKRRSIREMELQTRNDWRRKSRDQSTETSPLAH